MVWLSWTAIGAPPVAASPRQRYWSPRVAGPGDNRGRSGTGGGDRGRAADGNGDAAVHRHRGLDPAAALARRRLRAAAPGPPGDPAGRRSPATAGSSSAPRATPASSPSRRRPPPWPPPPRPRPPWPRPTGRAGPAPRVRMGVHTGSPVVVDDDYVGIDVHRAARICSAAHGGQVLVSGATRDAAEPGPGQALRDLGHHRLKDLDRARAPVPAGRGRAGRGLPAARGACPRPPTCPPSRPRSSAARPSWPRPASCWPGPGCGC